MKISKGKALTKSQAATLKHLSMSPKNSKFYYSKDGEKDGQPYLAGQLKPTYAKKVADMASRKVGQSLIGGRPPKTAEKLFRARRPKNEVSGQLLVEIRPQVFTGEEPKLLTFADYKAWLKALDG